MWHVMTNDFELVMAEKTWLYYSDSVNNEPVKWNSAIINIYYSQPSCFYHCEMSKCLPYNRNTFFSHLLQQVLLSWLREEAQVRSALRSTEDIKKKKKNLLTNKHANEKPETLDCGAAELFELYWISPVGIIANAPVGVLSN